MRINLDHQKEKHIVTVFIDAGGCIACMAGEEFCENPPATGFYPSKKFLDAVKKEMPEAEDVIDEGWKTLKILSEI